MAKIWRNIYNFDATEIDTDLSDTNSNMSKMSTGFSETSVDVPNINTDLSETSVNTFNSNFTDASASSNFNIRNEVSSVSQTSEAEYNIKNKLNILQGRGNMESNKEVDTVPLLYSLNYNMEGGSNGKLSEDSISTEQLESKLRSIFTNADNIQTGGMPTSSRGCQNDQEGNPIPHLKGGMPTSSRGCQSDQEGNPIPHLEGGMPTSSRGCQSDQEGNPIPHLEGGGCDGHSDDEENKCHHDKKGGCGPYEELENLSGGYNTKSESESNYNTSFSFSEIESDTVE